MELKVLYSEDPAFVLRRAGEFLSSKAVVHDLVLSVLHARVRASEISPEIGLAIRSESKLAWKDAYDGRRGPVQNNRFPNYILPAAKSRLPSGVAEKDSRSGIRPIIARAKTVAHHRRNSEGVKETSAYSRPRDLLGATPSRQGETSI